MKLNKIIFILFFPIMAQVTFSCCCCDDDATPLVLRETIINEINTQLIDNSGESLVYLSNFRKTDTVPKAAFGFSINAIQYAMADINCKETEFSFINSAYACSCGNDYYQFSEANITNFKIKTLSNFSNTITAGEDITDFFQLYNITSKDFTGINQDSLKLEFTRGNISNFLLTTAPENSGNYQFEISFNSNDTLVVTDTTKLVYLR